MSFICSRNDQFWYGTFKEDSYMPLLLLHCATMDIGFSLKNVTLYFYLHIFACCLEVRKSCHIILKQNLLIA